MIIRSIPWLLMPWLPVSPGHQQSWYWLCRINRSLSSVQNDFNYLCHLSFEKWEKIQIYVDVSLNKFNITSVILLYLTKYYWSSCAEKLHRETSNVETVLMRFQRHVWTAHPRGKDPVWVKKGRNSSGSNLPRILENTWGHGWWKGWG